MKNNLIIQNFYDFTFTNLNNYGPNLSLTSVLTISSEYFLITSILTISLFFILLPKLSLKHFNKKISIFSFINYQLHFLAVLILLFYCFLCIKQYFLFLSEIPTFNNSIFNDFTSMVTKCIIGFASIIYLIFIQRYLIDQQLNYFEYYILILTSVLGFCLLCCSNDLLTAYLAIELQGLSFYVLSSFKKNSNYSAESGVKYFIIGSFSTIIFLLGVNLIYGISGSIYIFDFKDLFVWIFSINSFFLSVDYLPKSLEFFQIEKTFNNEDLKISNNESILLNLKTILNNFLILKNKAYISIDDGIHFMRNLREPINYKQLGILDQCLVEMMHEPYEQINCFEPYLLENISKKMIHTTNNVNNSFSMLFNDRTNFFQLLFSEPQGLIISSAFQNLMGWFLTDIQNQGIKFDYYDTFLENFLEMNSEIEFLNNFKYNWVNISEIEYNTPEAFSQFNTPVNQNSFINDWSEYLSFRQLSESIDMALTIDIFSKFDPKKVKDFEIFNKTCENFDNNAINLKLILEKLTRFGYISLEDSKFLLKNINKVFANIQFSSNLDILFSFVTNFSDSKELFFAKYFFFSYVSKEEFDFYKKFSSSMIQYSGPMVKFSFLKNFNVLFENSSFRETIFASRAEQLLIDHSIENKLFLNNYFSTLNKISSYFLCMQDSWDPKKDTDRNFEIYFSNYFLDYYSKRMIVPVYYLETYFFKNPTFENENFVEASQNLNFNDKQDFEIFSKNISEIYEKKVFKLYNETYNEIFKEQHSLKFYTYDEFLSFLSYHDNAVESKSFISDCLPYYLIYLDVYKQNAELSYYLFDIITNLFNFIERVDFFETSNTNTNVIVSDYKQSLSETRVLSEILQRFELLNENTTLSISETRLIISQIKKILQDDSYDSNNIKLLNHLAHYMKSNFLEDKTIFKHRADILQKTKIFSFLLSDFKFIFKQVNEIVFNFFNDSLLACEEIFFLSDYATAISNIKKLFNIDSLVVLSNFNKTNQLNFDNNLDVLQIKDILSEKEFKKFLINDKLNSVFLTSLKSTSLKDISYEKFQSIKSLAIITHYILFYVVSDNNQESLAILPKDLNYYQRIDFLDFINLKINLFKHTFKPTRWEFEFLLSELKKSQNLTHFKDPILREKYNELFQNFKSIISNYLDNANRAIKTDIFAKSENYKNSYDARQTVWLPEFALHIISLKGLLINSNKTCELFSILLSNAFWKENVVSLYNIVPLSHNFELSELNNLHLKSVNLSKYNNYSIDLIHVLNLFPLFLDWSEDPILYNNFMFDTLLVELGLLLIIVSLFLKLALTPFHLWSPDIYEGSPSSTTFFFVVISKISIFAFLLKICYFSFYSMIGHWQFYSLFVAISSILLGSVAALKQRKVKSLLAYSSISNMGLILAAFSVGNFEGIKAVFYYFIIYIISGLSIWSIFLMLKLKKRKINEKYNKDLGDFSLLHESNTVLAYAFVIIIFTIAGIPPMVGFLAKVNVFLTLIFSSMNFIAFISIVTSVISTFYYIRILKVIFFENSLVGKLFHPINSKTIIIISFLFFLMLFLFINPSLLDFFSYKITLFLSKSFY